jgi:hypothetical protein
VEDIIFMDKNKLFKEKETWKKIVKEFFGPVNQRTYNLFLQ